MKVLIGIKNVTESGSFQGAEGFGGMSVDASKIDILFSGEPYQITAFFDNIKSDLKEAILYHEEYIKPLEYNTEITEEETDRLYSKYNELNKYSQYNEFLMIDGEILSI